MLHQSSFSRCGLPAVLILLFTTVNRAPAQLIADPPSESAVILSGKALELKAPDSIFGVEITYADQYGPFVALGRNGDQNDTRRIIDLRTFEIVGEIKGQLRVREPFALSPDGSRFAAHAHGLRGDSVAVVETKTGKITHELDAGRALMHLTFVGNDRLLTMSNEGKLVLWDATTGQAQRAMTATIADRKGKPAVSPGGRYVAYATGRELTCLDTRSGAVAGTIELPPGKPFPLDCQGLAFSPDGKQLAGVFKDFQKTRLLSWELGRKEPATDLVVEPRVAFYKGQMLEWSPDGSCWLVNGELVVDRVSGQTLWKVTTEAFSNQPRHILAPEAVLTLVENRGKQGRVLRLATPGKDVAAARQHIQAMQKAVRAGGHAIDVLLPKLTETSLEGVAQVSVPLGGIEWTVQPDPATGNPKAAPRPFSLQCKGEEVQSVLVARGATGQAVVDLLVKTDRAPEGNRVLERYDLMTGRRNARLELPATCRLLAVSPDAKSVVVEGGEDGGRLDVWQLDDGGHVAGWRPYAKEEDKQRRVTFAALLTEEQILTTNAAGKLVLWRLPLCQPAYVAEITGLTNLQLSPGGKYLLGLDRGVVRFFEPASGKAVGDLTPPFTPAAGENVKQAITVRPDGQELVALLPEVPGQSNTHRLIRWDLGSAKVLEEIPLNQAAQRLEYEGSDHLLLDDSQLLDLKKREIIWTYTLASAQGKHAPERPDGRHWYVAAPAPNQPASLVAISLPEASLLTRLSGFFDKLVFKPGDTVAMKLKLPNTERAKEVRDKLQENARKALESRGLKVASSAELVLTLEVQEKDTGKTINFRDMMPRGAPFRTQSVKILNLECSAVLQKGNETLWRSAVDKVPMPEPFGIVLHLPAGEDDPARHLHRKLYEQLTMWASRSVPPKYLARLEKGIVGLPGSTLLQPEGPRTQEPGTPVKR